MSDKKEILKSTCKGCQAPIVWLKSHISGKSVPVNPEGVEKDDVFFNYKKHTSHFATCVKAHELRKSSKGIRGKVAASSIVGVPSVDEIIREGVKLGEEFKDKLARDTRLFILKNKHKITVWRYSLLNTCAAQGMDFEDLVNFDNNALQDWLAERGPDASTPLSMTGSSAQFEQGGLFE